MTGADVVVVGAGIVGLACALAAVDSGLSVLVVDRDDRAVGASVRNFGHVCTTAQSGDALAYALAARETWLRVASQSPGWLRSDGTVVVAREPDESAVLEEFAARRGADQVRLLTSDEVTDRTGLSTARSGAWLPLDLRVDPRVAVTELTNLLADRGVAFRWGTSAREVLPTEVRTSRGVLRAGAVIVAVGHDVDRLFPEVAESAGVTRCALHMLLVSVRDMGQVAPAVLSGYSLLRYGGFLECPSTASVAERLASDRPEAVAAGLNLMFTQRPDGTLIIGDTHDYARTHQPFSDEPLDRLVLDETARLLGSTDLTVHERWRGVYAAAPQPYLVSEPMPGVHVVSVTSGIGMTTAFGLAESVLSGIGSPRSADVRLPFSDDSAAF